MMVEIASGEEFIHAHRLRILPHIQFTEFEMRRCGINNSNRYTSFKLLRRNLSHVCERGGKDTVTVIVFKTSP